MLPKMGESVSEATITRWLAAVGDTIQEDDTVAEIATDKVDSEVPSPVAGELKEILFAEGQVAQVGDVIAIIEVAGGEGEVDTTAANQVLEEDNELVESDIAVEDIPGVEDLGLDRAEVPTDADDTPLIVSNSGRFYSPLVKSIAQQEGLSQEDLDSIKGSGADGRVTKQDVLDFLAGNKAPCSAKTSCPDTTGTANTPVSTATAIKPELPQVKVAGNPVQVIKSMNGDEIVEMDRMRRLIADHMVQSIHTSPHVFSVVEADVTDLVNWRNGVKDAFKKREGENITFTPLIIEAIAKALRDFPMINVSVDGYNIIKRKHINIGMAAALPTGNLIVPVIKDADQLNLVGLSKSVNDLANRARANQLKPDDTQGGTFTFTNIGAFGNIFGMPIINQPQAAILAVGTITKKPAVLETEHGDVIAIRHMMYLTMSYDHRVIDGALGGTFLKRVADYLEKWDKGRII